jgi:hypothetical protein
MYNKHRAMGFFAVLGCSFVTLPNAFRQCTISLLIIHSAVMKM